MASFIFIDPTCSSATGGNIHTSRCEVQKVPNTRKFEGINRDTKENFTKRPVFLKDIDQSFGQIDPSKLSIPFTPALKDKETNQKKPIKPMSIMMISTPHQKKKSPSQSALLPPRGKSISINFKPDLISRSTNKLTKKRISFEKREKSLPNSRMFESMRNSWYPQASQGDTHDRESKMPVKQPSPSECSLMVDDKKSNLLKPRNKSNSTLRSRAHGLSTANLREANPSSMSITVKFSINASFKSKDKSDSRVESKNVSQTPSRIDTIIDFEKLLLKNEDFIRYCEEKKNEKSKNFKPHTGCNSIVRFKTFGSSLKKSPDVRISKKY